MRNVINTVIATVLMAVPAFAASGAQEDNSGIFVWIFLGLCALIVIGQLVPTLMVMLGFAKGMAKPAKSETA